MNLHFDLKEIITATMILFAVIDILGSVPIVIDLRKKAGHIQSGKATIVSIILMILFLFLGDEILNLIGIDVNSFAIVGSFIIFFIALEMILGITVFKDEIIGSHSIVPLAFPLIAGAGTMTTLISLRAEFALENIIVAIFINSIFVYFVLKTSQRLENILGSVGLNVLRKVFGVILLSIAVKLFTSNINQLF
ncbi:MAG: MarC family protein [Wenyingzhuangia sp.]|jgi:multiple antibiotic resistance protein|uniref:MarC family protein n=1 Tax=Wenyingzhuangia sp. TaxID=1964193 RepID=UPI00321AB528